MVAVPIENGRFLGDADVRVLHPIPPRQLSAPSSARSSSATAHSGSENVQHSQPTKEKAPEGAARAWPHVFVGRYA